MWNAMTSATQHLQGLQRAKFRRLFLCSLKTNSLAHEKAIEEEVAMTAGRLRIVGA
jgi:hypothetical protein